VQYWVWDRRWLVLPSPCSTELGKSCGAHGTARLPQLHQQAWSTSAPFLPQGAATPKPLFWAKRHPVTACPCHHPPHQWHILPSELLWLLPTSLCAPLAKMLQVQHYQHQHFWEMQMTVPRSLNPIIPALSIMDRCFLSRQSLGIMSNAQPDITLTNVSRESPNLPLFENNYIPYL